MCLVMYVHVTKVDVKEDEKEENLVKVSKYILEMVSQTEVFTTDRDDDREVPFQWEGVGKINFDNTK